MRNIGRYLVIGAIGFVLSLIIPVNVSGVRINMIVQPHDLGGSQAYQRAKQFGLMTKMTAKPRREAGAVEVFLARHSSQEESRAQKIIRVDLGLAPQHGKPKQRKDGSPALR